MDEIGVSTLLTLPIEIVNHIFRSLEKQDLKSFRLTCDRFQASATEALFHHFALYPHLRSCQDLRDIAGCQRIRSHVRVLELNTTFEALSTTLLHFSRNEDAWLESCDRESFRNDKVRISRKERLLQTFRAQALSSHNDADRFTILSTLHDCLPRLTRLNCVQLCESTVKSANWEDVYCPLTALPEFYLNVLGNGFGGIQEVDVGVTIGNKHSYTFDVLKAGNALCRSLESLSIHDATMSQIFRLNRERKLFAVGTAISSALENLKSLELHSGDDSPFDCELTRNLQAMLRRCTQLEHLALTLTKSPVHRMSLRSSLGEMDLSEQYDTLFRNTSGCLLTPYLVRSDKLRSLTLSGLVCTETEFQGIFTSANKAQNLRSLELSNVYLVQENIEGASRACLVRCIKWMSENLTLDRVLFSGDWSNGGMQTWELPLQDASTSLRRAGSKRQNNGSLRDDVHSYVLKGGPCPLEHVAIPPGLFDVGKPEPSKYVPSKLKSALYASDASWSMFYLGDIPDKSANADVAAIDIALPSSWVHSSASGHMQHWVTTNGTPMNVPQFMGSQGAGLGASASAW